MLAVVYACTASFVIFATLSVENWVTKLRLIASACVCRFFLCVFDLASCKLLRKTFVHSYEDCQGQGCEMNTSLLACLIFCVGRRVDDSRTSNHCSCCAGCRVKVSFNAIYASTELKAQHMRLSQKTDSSLSKCRSADAASKVDA